MTAKKVSYLKANSPGRETGGPYPWAVETELLSWAALSLGLPAKIWPWEQRNTSALSYSFNTNGCGRGKGSRPGISSQPPSHPTAAAFAGMVGGGWLLNVLAVSRAVLGPKVELAMLFAGCNNWSQEWKLGKGSRAGGRWPGWHTGLEMGQSVWGWEQIG